MNEFLELVNERLNKKLKLNKCPFCGKKDVSNHDTRTTLVGGPKGVNHEWTTCSCNKCGERYTFESKDLNNWITQDGVVKFGIPTCYESYIYSCKHCNGKVHRHQWEKDKDEPVRYLKHIFGSNEKNYRNVFKCNDCGSQIESENDYYYPDSRIKSIEKNNKNPKKLDPKWTLKIEDDIDVIYNMDVVGEIISLMSEDVVKEIDEQIKNEMETTPLTQDQKDACMDGFIYCPYIPKSINKKVPKKDEETK